MKQNDRYLLNFKTFCQTHPETRLYIEQADCSQLNFCYTATNELNLIDTSNKEPFYLYEQQGTKWEADNWVELQPLNHIQTLIIYGLGLGSYYLPLKKWLKANSRHRLVFVEDDARIISRFLSTKLATEILKNRQVEILFLPKLLLRDSESETTWSTNLYKDAFEFFVAYAGDSKHISALSSYLFRHTDFFEKLGIHFHFFFQKVSMILKILLSDLPLLQIKNFYGNIFNLTEASPGKEIFNCFKDIPTILSGAGPSINKQLPFFQHIKNQAIITAAGSGMNVLASAHITPHLAGGVDPNICQLSRLLTTQSFNVPILYTNQYYFKALQQWHGPRLYICDVAEGMPSPWFEKTLGIHNPEDLRTGISTSNFLLNVLQLLGTSPIIMTGIDLAYTNQKKYAEGVFIHPTDDDDVKKTILETAPKLDDTTDENIYTFANSDGTVGTTKIDWLMESMIIVDIHEAFPKTKMINASEGGMEILDIPNSSLQSAIKTHLSDIGDIQGLVHGTIQNITKQPPSYVKVKQAIDEWKTSLEKTLNYLKEIIKDLRQSHKQNSLLESELHKEPFYQTILVFLGERFDLFNMKQKQFINRIQNHNKQEKLFTQYKIKRFYFLLKNAQAHFQALKKSIKEDSQIRSYLKRTPKTIVKLLNNASPPPNYYINNQMEIVEPELNLNIHVSFNPALTNSKQLTTYSSGSIKTELFLKNGTLHGPWMFYNEQGKLLAKSWFVEGKKQGKSYYYYREGSLYSIQGYVNDLPEGTHLYYYPDGILKTEEHYSEGKLHGTVKLYYKNGQKKRELRFNQGKIYGQERMWNEAGRLIINATHPI